MASSTTEQTEIGMRGMNGRFSDLAFLSIVGFLGLSFLSLALLSPQNPLQLFGYGGCRNSSSDAAAIMISCVSGLCEEYQTEHGHYPKSLGDLPWERYTKDKAPVSDPWGNAYRYELSDMSKVCISLAGPDERFGTDDDISSSKAQY